MSTKTRSKFNLFDLTFIEEKSCRKKASCSTLKIWWIGNRSFCCSFKRILSRKIQLHRRRRNLLFSVLKILKSKSLKQIKCFCTTSIIFLVQGGFGWSTMVRIGFTDCGKIEINLFTKSFGNECFDFKLKHLNILSIF